MQKLELGRARAGSRDVLLPDEPACDESPRRLAEGSGQYRIVLGGGGEVVDAAVEEVMTRKVTCAREDATLAQLRATMLERSVSGVPIIDTAGRPVGIVTKTDLLEHADTDGATPAADIMQPFVFALRPSASIARAAALMAYEGVHRVVVVDERGRVAGIVSSLDVARWVGRAAGYPVP
jgi:CBS-domain-containing membrane protein